jgi:hypothetical protein
MPVFGIVGLALAWSGPGPSAATAARRASVRLANTIDYTSNTWGTLRLQLDTLPVFAVVDERGRLTSPMKPTFYVDMQAAQKACDAMREEMSDVDIMPMGLGTAYQAMAQGRGTIVPNAADLLDAADTSSRVPMFMCPELLAERVDGGTGSVPLFMSELDAREAVADATDGVGGLEIARMTLDEAIEKAMDPDALTADAPAFHFIAPSASVAAIRAAWEAETYGTDNLNVT